MAFFTILRIAGWAAAAAAVLYSVVSMSRRIGVERRGREDPFPAGRMSPAEADARCRRVMERDRLASIAHHMSVIGLVAGVLGHAASPLREAPGSIGAAAGVLAGVAFYGGALTLIAGSLISAARRIRGNNARFTRRPADLAPLLSQILLGASGAFYYYALGTGSGPLQSASGIFHDLTMALFLACFFSTKLYHVLGFIRLKRAGIPRRTGALPRDPGVEALRASEASDAIRIGLSGLEDLTALQRTEASACLSCGLCDAACPAARMGTGLSPMRLTLAQAGLMRGAAFPERLAVEAAACASCYACETACPFSIRKVDRVAGIRRHALLENGEAASSHRQALKNIERTGNIFGMDPDARRQLLCEAGIPFLDEGRPDYVLWLGCQAAYDPRMRSVVLAIAGLLRASGKRIAAFEAESCCGDFPRRIGEENLFLDLAAANTAAFARLDGVPILTVCPHCAVSLGREYAELGTDLDVVHYSQILKDLAGDGVEGRRHAAARPYRVAYHDSCYVARLLGIVEEPRRFLRRMRPDAELVPLAEEGIDTLCCGGGGGRILAEEKPNERIALRTIDQLAAKKVDALLVSCPNCLAMYADAAAFRESGIRVMDLVEFAAQARPVLSEGVRGRGRALIGICPVLLDTKTGNIQTCFQLIAGGIMKKTVLFLSCLALAGCASLSNREALAELSNVGVISVTCNAEIGWYGEEKSSGGLLGGAMNLLSNSGKEADAATSAVLSRADALIDIAEADLLDALSKAGGVHLRDRSSVISSAAYSKANEGGMTGMVLLKPPSYKFVDYNNAAFTKSMASELDLDACIQASFQLDKTVKTGVAKNGVMGAMVSLSVTVFDKSGKVVFSKSYNKIGTENLPVAAGIYDPLALQEAFKNTIAAACGDFAADFSH